MSAAAVAILLTTFVGPRLQGSPERTPASGGTVAERLDNLGRTLDGVGP